MRASPVPRNVRASQAVARGARFAGAIESAALSRLAVAAGPGSVQVDLVADRQGRSPAHLHGRLSGQLELVCQRGLHPFDWSFDLPVDLQLVNSDAQAKEVTGEADPYLVEDDTLPLHELIEEELLLALPMHPRCEDPECAGKP